MDLLKSQTQQISIKASDLRGILEYVPLYRGQIFVIVLDGSVVACDNFVNVITDIAVLRSLGVNVVVVYGIGCQLKNAGSERGVTLSDLYGTNPVDDTTLELSREISANVLQTIVDTFAAKNIVCVSSNAVRATEVGIISSVDYLNAGRIEKIDFEVIKNLLSLGMIPVIGPIAVDRQGRVFRMNSDMLAAELAIGLGATKLIFLTVTRGLMTGDESAVAIPLDKVKDILKNKSDSIDHRVLSKVKSSIKALESTSTRRAHILDGREFASLLTELFDRAGCGTMIYSDVYQRIRAAVADDIPIIYNLSLLSSKEQNLLYRTREDIASRIGSYYVYEVDGSIMAFVSLIDLGGGVAELAGLHVQPFFQGRDVGTHMVEFVKMRAKQSKFDRLFALTTKNAPFFLLNGFEEISPDELPEARLASYMANGRHSKVFVFNLRK